MIMEPWKELLQDNHTVRQLLDVYLELRRHFQEMGFSESDLDDPPTYTIQMIDLHEKFRNRLDRLLQYVKDYGFDISREELIKYVQPLLMNINELTPLSDGNSKRDDSRDEDY